MDHKRRMLEYEEGNAAHLSALRREKDALEDQLRQQVGRRRLGWAAEAGGVEQQRADRWCGSQRIVFGEQLSERDFALNVVGTCVSCSV